MPASASATRLATSIVAVRLGIRTCGLWLRRFRAAASARSRVGQADAASPELWRRVACLTPVGISSLLIANMRGVNRFARDQ
jgi:hypothetical protein